MLSHEEQVALMERIRTGDKTAFDQLHAALNKRVYGFIRARTDNDDDASEIAQETWLKFWRSVSNFDGARGGCTSFLLMIANSALIDYFRPRAKRYERLFSELLSQTEEGGEPDLEELLGFLLPNAVASIPQGLGAVVHRAILSATFGGTSPPHQLIAFGFAELLGWTPREVVADLSERRLRDLEAALENDYCTCAKISQATAEEAFHTLRSKLDTMVSEAVQDPKTRLSIPTILGALVGDTLLCQYYGDNPHQNISHWCQSVRRRVVSEYAQKPKAPKKSAEGCEKGSRHT